MRTAPWRCHGRGVLIGLLVLAFLAPDTAQAGRRDRRKAAARIANTGMHVEEAGGGQSVVARQPDVITLRVGDPVAFVQAGPHERERTARSIMMQFLDEADPTSGRWQVIYLTNLPLLYEKLPSTSRARLAERYGLDAARQYNQAVVTLLERVLAFVQRRQPGMPISVLGLPIEPELGTSDAARLANERFAGVIDRVDALASTRTFIRIRTKQNGPAVRVADSMPEAVRLRDGRPVLYRLNRVWYVSTPPATTMATPETRTDGPTGTERQDGGPVVAPEPQTPVVVPSGNGPAPLPRGSAREPGGVATRDPAPASSHATGDPVAVDQVARNDEPTQNVKSDPDAPAHGETASATPSRPRAQSRSNGNGRRRAAPRVRVSNDGDLQRVEGVRTGAHDGRLADCNENGVDDVQDVGDGTSEDCNENYVPDECESLPDADGDGTPDCADLCPNDPDKTNPGACGCNEVDTDRDGDGVPDCIDGCPDDPDKAAPGTCGCGTPDLDTDGDGAPDCVDDCPEDPDKVAPGDCGCGQPDSAGCLGAPILEPGGGFDGPTPEPAPIGAADDLGGTRSAIARWNVVPHQTVNEFLDVGVVAFHMAGIDRVDFSVENGPVASVRSMLRNPRTGVDEYWARVDVAGLMDGPIEVRAIVYPKVGLPHVLPPLPLFANSDGSLTPSELYVSVHGSDGGGDGTMDFPFRTVGRALLNVRDQLDELDGADIVILDAGEYDIDSPQNIVNERWVTIRPRDGLGRDDVVIAAGGWELVRPKTRRLHFQNVSLDFSRMMQMYKEDNHKQWYENCRWFQSEGWTFAVSPFLPPVRNVGYEGLFVTDSIANDTLYGFIGCNLVRGSAVERISGDCFQNSLVIINCTAKTVNGSVLEHHSDLLQYFGHFENLIVYGLKAMDIVATQNFFLDWNNSSFTNCAFVNIVVQNSEGNPPFSQLNSAHEHVLFAHVTNPGQRWVFRDDLTGSKKFTAADVVFVNCSLDRLARAIHSDKGVPAGVIVSHCHLVSGELHGESPTTGPIQVMDGPAWDFVIVGGGASLLTDTGQSIPGLRKPDESAGRGDPDRCAWPLTDAPVAAGGG